MWIVTNMLGKTLGEDLWILSMSLVSPSKAARVSIAIADGTDGIDSYHREYGWL